MPLHYRKQVMLKQLKNWKTHQQMSIAETLKGVTIQGKSKKKNRN
jgi:hypothetical protein